MKNSAWSQALRPLLLLVKIQSRFDRCVDIRLPHRADPQIMEEIIYLNESPPLGIARSKNMNRSRKIALGSLGIAALTLALAGPAHADVNKPGTHIKTIAGLASSLESAGVVLYGRGGATSGVMGDSVASPNGQVVFHIPITNSKSIVKHVGSTLVMFNTITNKQVELRNPVINLSAGTVRAAVGAGPVTTIFTITNAKTLKPVVKKDASTGTSTTMYDGAELSLAPGIAAALVDGLGLPAGSLVDGSRFATATVTLPSAS